MKTIFFAVLLTTTALSLKAQDKKQTLNPASEKRATELCNCLETNKAGSLKTKAEVEQIFVKCMLEAAQEDFAGVFDAEDANKFGEELGIQLAKDLLAIRCDVFIKISMVLAAEEENLAETVKAKSTTGTVLNVEERDFVYITVKSDNRELRFIYLNHVPESDTWIKNPASLKGKKVSVEWTETEVYQPKLKEFMNLKQIKKLSVL